VTRRMATLVAAATTALLAACGHTPTAGLVMNRSYEPAHTDTVTYCASYDSKGWCSTYVPHTTYYPQSWQLLIRDKNGDNWVDVDQATYEQARPGKSWSQAGGIQ
jgi:hypothetical protein